MGAASIDAKLSASDIVAGLRKRYAAPEWAMFFNVANGTGMHGKRYADAIAMCLFPSRGLEIHGFEIKVSKSDYRREAADPSKAETIAAYCDRWWVVTPPHLLDSELLPPNWGWLSYDGRAFYTKQKAEKTETKQLDRIFLSAVLRRANEAADALVDLRFKKKTEGIAEEIQAKVSAEVERQMLMRRNMQDSVTKFEESAGIKISDWNAGNVGKAVKIVLAAGHIATYDGAQNYAKRLRKIADDLDGAISEAGLANT